MMELLERTTKETKMLSIPIEWLSRGEYQPREHFDNVALEQLAQTIKLYGVLEPLLIRPRTKPNSYEIIAGERRWRAAQLAGLEKVPCIIVDYPDEQVAHIALIENIVREDLNPIEEAQAIHRVIDEFNYTHEAAAKVLGKSRAEITNSLRLLKLDERIKVWVVKGDLSDSHAKLLAGISGTKQYFLAKACVSKGWSSRQLEKAIKSEKGTMLKSVEMKSDGAILRLERQLSDYFGTTVRLNLDSPQKGTLSMTFHTLEILDGLLEKMGCRNED